MPKTLDTSLIVGPTKLAKMLGKSRTWAVNQLREWQAEQARGGPQRVFVTGKQRAIKTTLAIVQREFGGNIRDPVIMRKLQELERDLTVLYRRVDQLTSTIFALTKKVS